MRTLNLIVVIALLVALVMQPISGQEATPEPSGDVVVIETEAPQPDTSLETVIVVMLLGFVGLLLIFGGVITYALRLVYVSVPSGAQSTFKQGVIGAGDAALDKVGEFTSRTTIKVDDALEEYLEEWWQRTKTTAFDEEKKE